MQNRWSDVWVRIAGNAKRIKTEGDPFHWRCYVNLEGPEIAVHSFKVIGCQDVKNFIPATDPSGANPLGLTAWLDYYGDLEIKDNVAYITLKSC